MNDQGNPNQSNFRTNEMPAIPEKIFSKFWDDEIYKDLLGEYTSSFLKQMNGLAALLQASDPIPAQKFCHKMAGGLAVYGFEKLSKEIKDLETLLGSRALEKKEIVFICNYWIEAASSMKRAALSNSKPSAKSGDSSDSSGGKYEPSQP